MRRIEHASVGFSLGARARRSRPTGESLSFAGTNESNQSKVPERQRSEPDASARRFGCCVSLLTRHEEALSTLQVFLADELLLEQSSSSPTAFSFQPCNSVGWLAFEALCFAYFHLCQQMKVGRLSGETDGLPPTGTKNSPPFTPLIRLKSGRHPGTMTKRQEPALRHG